MCGIGGCRWWLQLHGRLTPSRPVVPASGYHTTGVRYVFLFCEGREREGEGEGGSGGCGGHGLSAQPRHAASPSAQCSSHQHVGCGHQLAQGLPAVGQNVFILQLQWVVWTGGKGVKWLRCAGPAAAAAPHTQTQPPTANCVCWGARTSKMVLLLPDDSSERTRAPDTLRAGMQGRQR